MTFYRKLFSFFIMSCKNTEDFKTAAREIISFNYGCWTELKEKKWQLNTNIQRTDGDMNNLYNVYLFGWMHLVAELQSKILRY